MGGVIKKVKRAVGLSPTKGQQAAVAASRRRAANLAAAASRQQAAERIRQNKIAADLKKQQQAFDAKVAKEKAIKAERVQRRRTGGRRGQLTFGLSGSGGVQKQDLSKLGGAA